MKRSDNSSAEVSEQKIVIIYQQLLVCQHTLGAINTGLCVGESPVWERAVKKGYMV